MTERDVKRLVDLPPELVEQVVDLAESYRRMAEQSNQPTITTADTWRVALHLQLARQEILQVDLIDAIRELTDVLRRFVPGAAEIVELDVDAVRGGAVVGEEGVAIVHEGEEIAQLEEEKPAPAKKPPPKKGRSKKTPAKEDKE